MSKRTAPSANSRASKQPRYVPQTQQILPNIPGVPPDLAPLLVSCLQSCAKFFALNDTPFVQQNDNTTATLQPSTNASVVETILSRMAPTEEQKKLEKKRERMNQDVESWLSALKRRAKECFKGSSSTIPLANFRYLWDLQQEHSRVPVKRASLHLCGLLLQKSSECRFYVSSDQVLLTYVTSVVQAKNVKSSSSNKQIACWQTEALEWLTLLSNEFGDLYPKFTVGQRFLQQRAPSLLNEHASANMTEGNMPDLRRIRDVAIKYGDEEMKRVDKLIQRAHQCLDILVPRMGNVASVEEDSKPAAVSNDTVGDGSDDDDDDDDIDWEEGDEEEAHAEAVERTLASMAATAGGLQGGTIEINLESNDDNEHSTSDDTMDGATQKRLQKTVQSIESRHMKRLSSWVNALIKADGLVLNGKSLVVMTADALHHRNVVLQNLIDRKQQLATIMASAAKLGISVDNVNATPTETTQNAAARATILPPPRQGAVLAIAARRRNDAKVAKRRSNKLQIKYRTS